MQFATTIRGLNWSLFGSRCYATATAGKSVLAELRKKTGYTFANCKKALELHNNDLAKAEQWLKQQAQEMGWSKATKLEGRSTTQGLVGVLASKNIGAILEVNCETDFVARNNHFKDFVQTASKSCIQTVSSIPTNNGHLSKIAFENEKLINIPTQDGKSLGDCLALMIGNVGENAKLRRAVCFKTESDVQITGLAHPTEISADGETAQLGKYGVLLAYKTHGAELENNLVKNLCQHIIGLNPTKVGDAQLDKPNENKDDESCLIFQEYLLDPSVTVGELIAENNLEIVDFHRFECGEKTQESC